MTESEKAILLKAISQCFGPLSLIVFLELAKIGMEAG